MNFNDAQLNPWIAMVNQQPQVDPRYLQYPDVQVMDEGGNFSSPPMQPLPAPVAKETRSEAVKTRETSPQVTSNSDYSALINRSNAKELESLSNQQAMIDQLKQRLAGVDSQELPMNLQPLAALTDAWTGSNLAKYAAPQETAQSRAALKDRLTAQIMGAQQGMTDQEIAMMKAQLGNQLKMDEMAYKKSMDAEHLKLSKDRLAADKEMATAKRGLNLTPAQTSIDKKFGEMYDDMVIKGGFAGVEANLKNLAGAATTLKNDPNVTGGAIGLTPRFFVDRLNPDTARTRDQILSTVNETLKQIYGAQFTEKEGERILNQTFNPALPPAENLRRLDLLIEKLQKAAAQKAELIREYEAKGTISQYKFRPEDLSISAFNIDDASTKSTAGTPDRKQALQNRLKELEAK